MNAATTITAHGLTGFLGRGAAQRELECLLEVAGGSTGKEAAQALGMSEDSVKKRLLSLTTKLGVTRRAALVAEAFRLGLIAFTGNMTPAPHQHHERDSHDGVFIA
ncbi:MULTISPECIES: helix-turn-helix transcriptional regulator [unclassified Pseudomonas]|uniref:helix-turn-helix transcriptional regulator n=1 Tax=unclassified Pseudomonas TaxID=196821 RepID=UPI000A1DD1ED|nr:MULTISPECIES: helix-turn-helix transcriptional regulator [unclassified Pseudomonas]